MGDDGMRKLGYKEEILVVDTEQRDDDSFVLHPSQLRWVDKLAENSFDRVIVDNTPSENLRQRVLFNLRRVLRKNGTLELIVCPKIGVWQNLDADEIKTCSKLAGFANIKQTDYERFVKGKNGDERKRSYKITMTKADNDVYDEVPHQKKILLV